MRFGIVDLKFVGLRFEGLMFVGLRFVGLWRSHSGIQNVVDKSLELISNVLENKFATSIQD